MPALVATCGAFGEAVATKASVLSGALGFVVDLNLASLGTDATDEPQRGTVDSPEGIDVVERGSDGVCATGASTPDWGSGVFLVELPEPPPEIDLGEDTPEPVRTVCDADSDETARALEEWLRSRAEVDSNTAVVVVGDLRSPDGRALCLSVCERLGAAASSLPRWTAPSVVLAGVWTDSRQGAVVPAAVDDYVAGCGQALSTCRSLLVIEMSDSLSTGGETLLLSEEHLVDACAALAHTLASSSDLRRVIFGEQGHRFTSGDDGAAAVARATLGFRALAAGEISSAAVRDFAVSLCDAFVLPRSERLPGVLQPGDGWLGGIGEVDDRVTARLLRVPHGPHATADMRDRFKSDPPLASGSASLVLPMAFLDARRLTLMTEATLLADWLRENARSWRGDLAAELAELVDRAVENEVVSLGDAHLALEELNVRLETADPARFLQRGEVQTFTTLLQSLREGIALEPHWWSLVTRYVACALLIFAMSMSAVQSTLSAPVGPLGTAGVGVVLVAAAFAAAAVHRRFVSRRREADLRQVSAALKSWHTGDIERLAAREIRRGTERMRTDIETQHLPALENFSREHTLLRAALEDVDTDADRLLLFESVENLLGTSSSPRSLADVAGAAREYLSPARGRRGWRSLGARILAARLVAHARGVVGLGDEPTVEVAVMADARAQGGGEAMSAVRAYFGRPTDMVRHADRRSAGGRSVLIVVSDPSSPLWVSLPDGVARIAWDEPQPIAMHLELEWM